MTANDELKGMWKEPVVAFFWRYRYYLLVGVAWVKWQESDKDNWSDPRFVRSWVLWYTVVNQLLEQRIAFCGTCSEHDESSLLSHFLFPTDPFWYLAFPLGFLTKVLYAFFVCPLRTTCRATLMRGSWEWIEILSGTPKCCTGFRFDLEKIVACHLVVIPESEDRLPGLKKVLIVFSSWSKLWNNTALFYVACTLVCSRKRHVVAVVGRDASDAI